MIRPEGTRAGRATSWTALGALLLAPLLIVISVISLLEGDESRIDAAIVNLDEGTEIDGQFVPMGRQLAAEMMGRDGENVNWVLADETSAADGLVDGDYAAVVTIPEDFSERAMSFSENDATTAEKARIDISTSRNAPVTDAGVAQEIARLAITSLNNILTSQYLDGIYVGFNQVGEQFGQIVDGANQLHTGSTQLADGTVEASDGAVQLADGMGQLVAGSTPLVEGGDQLADGAGQISDGTAGLADGADQLNDGVQQMAGQIPQLTGGVSQLADGAEQLLPGVAQYTDGTVQALGGVGQIADGLDQVVTGLEQAGDPDFSQLQQLSDGANRLADGQAQTADGAQELAAGIDQLADGVAPLEDYINDDTVAITRDAHTWVVQVRDQLPQIDQKLQGYADGSLPIPDEVIEAREELKSQFECTVEDAQVCELLRQAYEQGLDEASTTGFRVGAGVTSDILHSVDPETGRTVMELSQDFGTQVADGLAQVTDGLEQGQQLISGVDQLRDGAHELADGQAELADGQQQLADGVDQLVTQLPQQLSSQMGELKTGLTQLRDGAQTIVTQTQPLVDNGPRLASGSQQLLEGIQQLDAQVGQLPAGVNQLADGTQRLADGASQLSQGAGEYTDGIYQYVDGVWQYTQGVDQASAGTGELADGLTQLSDGATQLDDGLGQFADKLEEGQSQVPSYSESDRETLSEVVSDPVADDDSLIQSGQSSLTALLIACALWVAGLASFVIARPVPTDVVTSDASSLSLWGRTIALPSGIAAGVGLLAGLIGGMVLDAGLTRTLGVMGLAAVLGVAFVLANHALSGWLGHVGRAVSVVLVGITVALGLSSAIPGWLDALASASPLHNGMLVLRGWLAGANIMPAFGMVLFVGLIVAAASWSVIGMNRQLTAEKFRTRHA